ncbi:hypothetical protein TNCV_1342971 [Trichonephila clavipes]|nr:hypothetical protein TNCV_1342971 [Trichonephila clavipes]
MATPGSLFKPSPLVHEDNLGIRPEMRRIRVTGKFAKCLNMRVHAKAHFVDQGTELAGVKTPKVNTGYFFGWVTRIWIRISEIAITMMFFAGMRSKVLKLSVASVFLSTTVTELEGAALRKQDYNKNLRWKFIFKFLPLC